MRKQNGVVVALVQRDPGDGPSAASDPFGRLTATPATSTRSGVLAVAGRAHSLSSVVLPKPAGAEMSVSLWCSPAFNRSIKRGRDTNLVLSYALSAVEGVVEGPVLSLALSKVEGSVEGSGQAEGDIEFGFQEWGSHSSA